MVRGKFYALRSILIMLLTITGQHCIAQNSSAISDPRIVLQDNLLHISYDILNSNDSDRYTVRIEITDTQGKVIEAKSMNGDIGKDVGGGLNKHVSWDFKADKVDLNSNINFTIYANPEPKPEPVSVKLVEDLDDDQLADNEKEKIAVVEEKKLAPREEEKDDPKLEDIKKESEGPAETGRVKAEKQFNRTGLILQSIPLPGLGLSRLKGKPHWLKGIAGYGCVGGALYFKQLAKASYAEQDAASDVRWETYYHDVGVWQDNISMGLAGAALAIWLSDIIWTTLGTSELKKGPVYGDLSGFQIGADYEPVFSSPLLKLTYTF